MNTTKQTTVIEGNKYMNTNRSDHIKENKMKITASKLIRWAGLSAMAAGSFSRAFSRSIHLTFFRQSTPAYGQSSPP